MAHKQTHALGSGDHSASTVAEINAKISDGSIPTDAESTKIDNIALVKSGTESIIREGRTPANYGTVGDYATDLSHSAGDNVYEGATGLESIAIGVDILASSSNSIGIGNNIKAEGSDSIVIGNRCLSHPLADDGVAIGGPYAYATASGAVAIGQYVDANNANSVAMGRYNVGTSPDTVFEFGIGTDDGLEANAFEIYGDGTITAPESTPALIDSRDAKALVTKEWTEQAPVNTATQNALDLKDDRYSFVYDTVLPATLAVNTHYFIGNVADIAEYTGLPAGVAGDRIRVTKTSVNAFVIELGLFNLPDDIGGTTYASNISEPYLVDEYLCVAPNQWVSVFISEKFLTRAERENIRYITGHSDGTIELVDATVAEIDSRGAKAVVTLERLGYTLTETITSADTLDTDNVRVVCKTNAFLLTLPNPATVTGKDYTITNHYSNTGNLITFSESINGDASLAISAGESIDIYSDGTEWLLK